MRNVALIDTNYFCHLALHTTAQLDNGIILGVLKMLAALEERIGNHDYVFCFDSKASLRKTIYPAYKENRKVDPRIDMDQFHADKDKLIAEVIPAFCPAVAIMPGYEADDLIAAYANRYLPRGVTIVSGDADLYQLLCPSVRMWQPSKKTFMTCKAFVFQYDIEPRLWAQVKAIAGCSSDNIKGVEGIGEKRALQYLLEELSEKQAAKIDAAAKLIEENLRLVKLPFETFPKDSLSIPPAPIDYEALADVCNKFDFKSIRPKGVKPRA